MHISRNNLLSLQRIIVGKSSINPVKSIYQNKLQLNEYLFVLEKEHPSNFNEFYLFSEKNSIENAALLKHLQKYTSILTSYLSNAPEGLEK